MHLIQILLPLYDNDGRAQPDESFRKVRDELAARFGGITAYMRAPAEGQWTRRGRITRDEIIVVEIMVRELDPDWWSDYRRELEARFRQHTVIVRAQECRLL